MKTYKFILSGGGTGGHIYPAIAIANELKKRYPSAEFLFVGAADKMEMQKVPQAGYAIKGLWIAGLQRKVTFQNLLFPIKLLHSLFKSFFIIKQFKPNIVIGTGGFASGPLMYMANMLGIPTLIQEQNSYPGITNKLLSSKSQKICVAYPHLDRFFPKNKIIITGNPVRQDLLNIDIKREEAIAYFNLDKSRKTLLVLGGSLGARRINELIAKQLKFFENKGIQLIWQCGKLYYDDYKQYNTAIDNQNFTTDKLHYATDKSQLHDGKLHRTTDIEHLTTDKEHTTPDNQHSTKDEMQLHDGKSHRTTDIEHRTTENHHQTTVLAFIDKMDLAYAAADFIISRAGASSVSELCIVGKPVLFIPSPNVAEDHQTKNAQSIIDNNGGVMIKEKDLNDNFQTICNDLFNNNDLQQSLSENIKALALPNATNEIVDAIIKIID